MKARKKLGLGAGGVKTLFVEHIEKMVLGLVLILVVAFVYFGSTVETFPETKTPASLQQVVSRARENIEEKTFHKVKETYVPPSIENPIVIRTNEKDFELVTLDERIQPPRSKRKDPAIFPPSNIEVYAVTAGVAMLPKEEEIAAIEMKHREQIERQQQPLIQEEPLLDKKKKKKGGGREEFDPLAGGRGVGLGGVGGPAQPRQLDEELREELMQMQARVQNTSIARSRNIVAVKALIPYKQQLQEYRDALTGITTELNEERDTPTYVFFKVERADVTDNPNADPKTLKWTLLSTNLARDLPYLEGAEWESIPEELVDPSAILPATDRFGALTLPVPPVVLTDIKKLAGHSEIAWASTLNGPEGVGGMKKKPDDVVKPEGPDVPEGPETPEGPDAKKGPRIDEGPGGYRGNPGGPIRGPGGRGRGGIEAGFNGNQEVTYKLFRFIDFDVERGRQYRYRVSLMLEDPNHPQIQTTGTGRESVGASNNGNDPEPASLDKTVENRLRALKEKEDATKRRIWYRETEWSEPSQIVTIPDPMLFVGGPTTAARETPIPGTTARVATGEPSGKLLVVQWKDEYATNVVAEEEVLRGSSLNFTKDAEALHPVRLEYVELKDEPIHTDAFVVDIRGGDRLPGGLGTPSLSPGKTALIDHTGRLIVVDEADDIKLWHRYGKVEPKKIADAEPEGMEEGILPPTRRPRTRRGE